MIRDGYLTYPFPSSVSPSQWFIGNNLLSASLFCVLAPFLIFLLTTWFYDLFFGFKRKDLVPISNLHLYLLTASGPLTILAALFRVDLLDRFRFRGAVPFNNAIGRHPTPIRFLVSLKTILLLSIAPVFSIIVLLFPKITSTTLTFQNVNFGGLALSISSNSTSSLSLDHHLPLVAGCSLPPILTAKTDDPLLQLSLCTTETTAPPTILKSSAMSIDIFVDSKSSIVTTLSSQSFAIKFNTSAYVQIPSKSLQIQHAISSDQVTQLVNQAADLVSKSCPDRNSEREFNKLEQPKTSNPHVRAIITCLESYGIDKEIMETTARSIINKITLVDSPKFKVHDVRNKLTSNRNEVTYFDASNIPFISRHSQLVPIGWLIIATIIAFVLKVFTQLILNNDIGAGVEAIVKSMVGVAENDTLIRVDGYVRYNHKYQVGKSGHYGVERPGMDEVAEFQDAIVGGDVDVMVELIGDEALDNLNQTTVQVETNDLQNNKYPHEFDEGLEMAQTEMLS